MTDKCTEIQENKVFRLNAASAQIVDSLCSIKEEINSLDNTDEKCRKLQSKMASVLQSCANQHLVSKEVYSEKPMKKKPIPHTYKIKQKLRTVFKCSLCKSVFSSRERLNNHSKFNHSSVTAKKKIHICSYCGKKIGKSLQRLSKHINQRHKNGKETINYKQKTAVNNIVYQHICILCKKTFEMESDLEKHFPTCGLLNSDKGIKKKEVDKLKVENDNETNTDNSCDGTKILKGSSEQPYIKASKIICDVCDKPFHSTENFTLHVNTCKKVNLPCEKCGKKFISVKQYQNHLRQCKDIYFTCDVCNKTFRRKDSLLCHIKVHYINIENYRCPLCSTTFSTEGDLQKHTVNEHVKVK